MLLDREKTIHTLTLVGKILIDGSNGVEKEKFQVPISEELYEKMQKAVVTAYLYNGWFTKDSIEESFRNWGVVLKESELHDWLKDYQIAENPKKVGLILAGNIPMVGLHDVLSVILSGHKAMIKLSQDDRVLIPLILEIAASFQPELKEYFELTDQLKNIEAVIATGSNNTARYFEKYFGHLPHIIRKNRTSIAILTGNETKEKLELLGKDIFTYFGLGCRNVSHLLFPKGYDLDIFFGAIVKFGEVINHNKYGNNYDYYKAIFLLNEDKIIENGFVLMQEKLDLHTPVAVLNYHFYESQKEVDDYLKLHNSDIQVVVGEKYLPFGSTQCPMLNEYADNVDTMRFLETI